MLPRQAATRMGDRVAVLLGCDVPAGHGCRRWCACGSRVSQGSQRWDIVGAVLTGSAIADVILLSRWRGFAGGTVRSCRSSRLDNNADCPIRCDLASARMAVLRLSSDVCGGVNWVVVVVEVFVWASEHREPHRGKHQ